ncbi:GNAT family N-acetyltransferase [Cellulomonas sp. DKR-3]|uniref:GNAT family N-acetyltransferase n=1 Tax=Cellulomonas fulva TaxID=2835530 RepID=A0ABS5U0T9_9CELL|nr:GNAT family N-acetyltransferase [Cellulomonas fulva]MBT0995019.1 GNAT family N-acetyltransferase [Cellulomonas fulva]
MTALDLLPPRWRSDRFLRTDAPGWHDVEVVGDDEAVVVVVDSPHVERAVVGRGDAGRVRGLLADLARRRAGRPHGWMSVPRGTSPSDDVLAALGLRPFSSWDWFASTTCPDGLADRPPGGAPAPALEPAAAVRELDRVADAAEIRACLAEANPGTSADPGGALEAAWFGVADHDALVGVIGASLRPAADSAHAASWHLHGLGVRPRARRRGLGAALTAAATTAGLRAGAPWVSLGMYADNAGARRIYERLGYVCEARFDSFGPPTAERPPS